MSNDLWDKKYKILRAYVYELLEEKDDLSVTLQNAEKEYEEAKYKFNNCIGCIKQINQELKQMRKELADRK
jgi:phage shock protein A